MKQWTNEGIARLDAQIEDLERRIGQVPRIRAELGFGRGMITEDALSDTALINGEVSMLAMRLAVLTMERSQLMPAPLPAGTEEAQVGHPLRIRYLSSSRRAAGNVETIILGGAGESDTDSIPHTISSVSAMGKALIRQKAGEEIAFTSRNGEHVIMIEEIEMPYGDRARLVAHAA